MVIHKKILDEAIATWQAGQLVAMPTETVYGLGADACNDEAVAAIFARKGRPQFNPLIVHVANQPMAASYVQFNEKALALAEAFWPGPLTLVLPRTSDCPVSLLASAGGDTLGVRMPAHPVAQALLQAFGRGVAAPSANRSGRISPTCAAHVREEFADNPPFIIEGDAASIGLESTVIGLASDSAVLLRPGSITQQEIEAVIGPVELAHAQSAITSPGMLASHYAPSHRLRLNASEVQQGEVLLAFGDDVPQGVQQVLNLSPAGDLKQAAARLFAYMRQADTLAETGIAVMPIPMEGIGVAINDRLRRAAAKK